MSFDQFLWVLASVLGVTVFYYSFIQKWRFFAKYRIKYDLGIPPLGSHFRELFGYESWYETLKRLYYQYPNERFVGMFDVGGRPEFLIRDPELVKLITIRDFNSFVNRTSNYNAGTDPLIGHELTNLKTDDWKRIRNILSPLFTGQKLRQLVVPALNSTKSDLVAYLKEQIESSNEKDLTVDAMDLATRSSIDSFCLTAFGLQTDSLRGDDYGYYKATQLFFKDTETKGSFEKRAIETYPWVMKHLFGRTLTTNFLNNFFGQSCRDIAVNRILKKINRNDYMQLLQVLRDKDTIDDDNAKKDYTEDELVAQCFEFYESTITEDNLLATFIARELANNHDIQNRLRNEFTQVYEKLNGEPLSYEVCCNEMKYMDIVISEALRICPIAPQMKRRATKTYILENYNGEKVPVQPGDAIWIPANVMQNDQKYYENPTVFDPERFSDDNRKTHVAGTYAPYGMGLRDCVGCRYANMEVKLTFYYLLQNFVIYKIDDGQQENLHRQHIRLVPKYQC